MACSVLCSLKSLKSELSAYLSSELLRGTQVSENKGLSKQAASAAECTNHSGTIKDKRQERSRAAGTLQTCNPMFDLPEITRLSLSVARQKQPVSLAG